MLYLQLVFSVPEIQKNCLKWLLVHIFLLLTFLKCSGHLMQGDFILLAYNIFAMLLLICCKDALFFSCAFLSATVSHAAIFMHNTSSGPERIGALR